MELSDTERTEQNRARSLWRWIDQRLGLADLAYPVPAHANGVLYTLGGITAFGILVLFATGIYLTQFYHPHPSQARQSVVYIMQFATLGDFIRSLHFWIANLTVITLLLHALRVFVTGAYRAPRELNWVAGIGLFGIMLGLLFTGTVLKWDQEGWEALKHNEEIGNLLGGMGVWFTEEFSTSTPLLERLFVAHVAILPMLLLGLMAVHFFLIKHHGIASLPGHQEQRPTSRTDTQEALRTEGAVPFSNHALHIAGWGLLLTALGGLLALVFSAPLGAVIQPGMEVTKPLWVFLMLYPLEDWFGIKALLWAPLIGFVVLLVVPWLDRTPSSALRRRRVLIAAGLLVIVVLAGLAIYAGLEAPATHIPD